MITKYPRLYVRNHPDEPTGPRDLIDVHPASPDEILQHPAVVAALARTDEEKAVLVALLAAQGDEFAQARHVPDDAAPLASANRELLAQLDAARSVEGILAHLRAHPEQAFEVARLLRVAGPWEPDDYDPPVSYRRRTAQGGSVSAHGTSLSKLERADHRLRQGGYVLVGGIPDDLPPRCGEQHVGWESFRTYHDGEPATVLFVCDMPEGHVQACSRWHVSAYNAMERRKARVERANDG